MWENPETEIEAVHLAIALSYHGLLRVPSRTETSDMTRVFYSSALPSHLLISISVTLTPNGPPALSLPTLIWRYVRQFVKMDAKEALQYVYTVSLNSDQAGGIGQEQVENALELVRRIITLANSGPAWDELVGGFRADGTRFVRPSSRVSPSNTEVPLFVSRTALSNKAQRCSSSRTRGSSMNRSLCAH